MRFLEKLLKLAIISFLAYLLFTLVLFLFMLFVGKVFSHENFFAGMSVLEFFKISGFTFVALGALVLFSKGKKK